MNMLAAYEAQKKIRRIGFGATPERAGNQLARQRQIAVYWLLVVGVRQIDVARMTGVSAGKVSRIARALRESSG